MTDEPKSPITLDGLREDLARYKKRKRFIEKQLFHLAREKELLDGILQSVQQAYDYAREAEKELRNFGKTKPSAKNRTYSCTCVECLKSFEATWKGRKHCPVCIKGNKHAMAAQRTQMRRMGRVK